VISSTTNKQVKYVNNLVKKAKARREEDLFVAEGVRMCSEIPKDRIRALYISESFSRQPQAAKLTAGVRNVEVVTDEVFRTLSDTQTPQGILALVKQHHYELKDILGSGSASWTDAQKKSRESDTTGKIPAPLIMILEHLQDPGNLGTILRAGEGAGVTGILMDRETADIYNPKVTRSTMGSILRVPFVYTDDLHGAVRELKDAGVKVYAAHLQGKNSYDQEDFSGATAFMIGNEGNGLTDETAALADTYIRIPMLGRVESLNAAVASSVLMFEAARQRRQE
jgi:TrmH family RNA methyltransferase